MLTGFSSGSTVCFVVISLLFVFVVYLSRLMTKPTKWHVRTTTTQISLGIRLIRVFAVRMKKGWVLSYSLSAQRRLWSDWADAQADLSLRWAHTHFVGFVMSRRICLLFVLELSTIETYDWRNTCQRYRQNKIPQLFYAATFMLTYLPKHILLFSFGSPMRLICETYMGKDGTWKTNYITCIVCYIGLKSTPDVDTDFMAKFLPSLPEYDHLIHRCKIWTTVKALIFERCCS